MKKIQMVDLEEQFTEAYPDMTPTPGMLLESGQYIGGPLVGDFEQAWAKYCGVKYAIGTSSGTSALTASFMALVSRWRGSRMRVITQANTFVATANAALRIRDMAVQFIDCDEHFGMSVSGLQHVLERDKGAYDLTIVVPVHMYGIMCDMQSIVTLVNQYDNVFMVEDASHAHGSRDIFGRQAGSYGDLSAFSLFPAKPLGAAGDAGVVITNHEPYAKYVRSYCNVGRGEGWDVYDKVGFTYRLDTVQALILRAKLRCLDSWRSKRCFLAQKYFQAWADAEEIKLPYLRPTCAETAWYAFPLRVPPSKRQKLQDHLFEKGIPCKRYYHQVAPDAKWMGSEPNASVIASITLARKFCEEILCIPLHEFLEMEQQQFIIQEVKKGLGG